MRRPEKHPYALVLGIAVVLMLAPLAVACGGDDGDDETLQTETTAATEPATATDERAATEEDGDAFTETDEGDGERVAAEAEHLRDVLEDELRGIEDVSSLEDLEARVASARSELESSRERLDDIDASGLAEERRDELESAVARVDNELADVQREVDDRDLLGALDATRSLSVRDLERAIDRAEELDEDQ